jgi:hypothetical protein
LIIFHEFYSIRELFPKSYLHPKFETPKDGISIEIYIKVLTVSFSSVSVQRVPNAMNLPPPSPNSRNTPNNNQSENTPTASGASIHPPIQCDLPTPTTIDEVPCLHCGGNSEFAVDCTKCKGASMIVLG